MDELKPCPFCNQPPITTPSGEGGKGLMIECLTEGCVNPHVSYYNHDVARTAWNTRAPVASGDVKPAAYAVYGNAEGYGPVMLPEYVGSMEVIRNRVIANALREGFTGNFVERMAELGWWLEKLYATPRAAEAVADEWRPIETAPEGVMILLADMTATEARHWAFVGWKHHWNKDGHVETPSAINRRATHWRPLPAPPALAVALGNSNG